MAKSKKRVIKKKRIPATSCDNPKSIRRFLNRRAWKNAQHKISYGRNGLVGLFLKRLKKDISNKMSLGAFNRFVNF